MEENELGIEEVRTQLGDLVDDAHSEGTITRITRRGRHVASIIPAGMKATGLPDEAIEAAVDAAWPDLPPGVTMGQARRRVLAALNAAYPYLTVESEPEPLPNIERLQFVIDDTRKLLKEGRMPKADRERLEQGIADIGELIRQTQTKMTHQETLTKAVLADGGTWDADRAIATLATAGHAVTPQRARGVLRRVAAAGHLIRTSPTRAIYEAAEK